MTPSFNESRATIERLGQGNRVVEVKRGKAAGEQPPRALIPGAPFSTNAQVDSLFSFADRVADSGLGTPTPTRSPGWMSTQVRSRSTYRPRLCARPFVVNPSVTANLQLSDGTAR